MVGDGRADAQVWLMEPGDHGPDDDVRRLLPLLDDDERDRHAALKADHARWSYVAAHALCRAQLSSRFGGAAASWRFARTDLGRPVLTPAPAGLPADGFSLSHAPGVAASALLPAAAPAEAAIGVDVEAEGRDLSPLPLARRFFHPEETADLERLPEAARRPAFLALWTVKEAVTKALGRGLQQSFSAFRASAEPPALVAAGDDLRPLASWFITRGRSESGALWALALRFPARHNPTVKVRHFQGARALYDFMGW